MLADDELDERNFGQGAFERDRGFGSDRFDRDRAFGQNVFNQDREFADRLNRQDFNEVFDVREADRAFDFTGRNFMNQEDQIQFQQLAQLLGLVPGNPIGNIDVTGAFNAQQQGRELRFDAETQRNQQNRDFLTDLFGDIFG